MRSSDDFPVNNDDNNNSSSSGNRVEAAAAERREVSFEKKAASPARTVDVSLSPNLTSQHEGDDTTCCNSPPRARRPSMTGRTFQRVKLAIGRRTSLPASPAAARRPSKAIIGLRRSKKLPGMTRIGSIHSSSACSSADNSPKRRNSEGDLMELQSMLCSGARSLKGRKHAYKSNEDTFFAIDDLFATTTRTTPGGGGVVSAEVTSPSPAIMASPSPRDIGKVGVFGVFDGHGGPRCSAFVAQNFPVAIANSRAWARLGVGSTSSRSSDKTRPKNTAVTMSACSSPSRPSVVADKNFHGLVRDVMQEVMLDAFQSTQARFEAFARDQGDDSGSTAVVAMVWQGWVVIANLGDSGALFHNDNMFVELGGSYTARTECHTVGNSKEKERVEAAGGSFSNGGRLFGTLQPTRSFGDMDIHRVKEGVLSAMPTLTTHRILPTAGMACLVLGSDGLWGSISESKLMEILRAADARQRKRKPKDKASKMAESLTQAAARRGTGDDVTAVVVVLA